MQMTALRVRRTSTGLLAIFMTSLALAACDSATNSFSSGGSAGTGVTVGQGALTSVDVQSGPSDADKKTVEAVRGTWSGATVDAVIKALAGVGIGVTADATSTQLIAPVSGTPVFTLLQAQAHSMARAANNGTGIAGSQLDAALPAPKGTVQYSSFLAAWVSHWDSPRARLAHAFMGNQDWTNGAGIGWSTLVLALFQADATEAAARDTGTQDPLNGLPTPLTSEGQAPPPSIPAPSPSPSTDTSSSTTSGAAYLPNSGVQSATLAALRPVGPTAADPVVTACQSVADHVRNIVDDVAGKLKIDPAKINTGSKVGNAVLGFFAALWNIAVTTLQVVVNNVAMSLDASLFGWLRAGIGVVAIIVQMVDLFKPVDLIVILAPEDVTFAIDDAADNTGTAAGMVLGAPDNIPYPPEIDACANAAHAPLPQRGIKGANYTWTIDEPKGSIPLVTTTDPLQGVATENKVTLHWTTGRETSVDVGASDNPTENVKFTFHTDNRLIRTALDALKAQVVSSFGRIGGGVGALVAQTVQHYLDQAVNAILQNIGASADRTLGVEHARHVACKS
jgi:hypothetical protein